MSVATEPEIIRATGTFVTNAAANTAQTDALIAAPGAGFRLRVYWITLTWVISATVAPPAASSGIISRLLQASVVLSITWPQHPFALWSMPQGAALATNTALNSVEAATAASLNYYYGVGYVVESV